MHVLMHPTSLIQRTRSIIFLVSAYSLAFSLNAYFWHLRLPDLPSLIMFLFKWILGCNIWGGFGFAHSCDRPRIQTDVASWAPPNYKRPRSLVALDSRACAGGSARETHRKRTRPLRSLHFTLVERTFFRKRSERSQRAFHSRPLQLCTPSHPLRRRTVVTSKPGNHLF